MPPALLPVVDLKVPTIHSAAHVAFVANSGAVLQAVKFWPPFHAVIKDVMDFRCRPVIAILAIRVQAQQFGFEQVILVGH
jgi:hypothetical protein